jgi:hypothetical protein
MVDDDKLEKLAKAYHKAVSAKEEADEFKRELLADLLIAEDSGQNTEKPRQALAIAKDNVLLGEKRVQAKLDQLRNHIGKDIDKKLKKLPRLFEELKDRCNSHIYEAGVRVGQAEQYLASLGPEHATGRDMLRTIVDRYKSDTSMETTFFTQGYDEGVKLDLPGLHTTKNEVIKLKRVSIYARERRLYEEKMVHSALRKYGK